jgi:hypothetical protein
MANAELEFPSDLENGNDLADWAEAVMLLEGRAGISRAELKRRLRDRVDEDLAVGLMLEQVKIRSARAKRSYPFKRTRQGIERRANIDQTLYEFLLWLSIPQSPVRKKHEYRLVDRYFDRVVLKALLAYLGPKARGRRFGTPASDGRPTGFADALIWIANAMGVDHQGSIPPNDKKNDAGVDVIAWMPFAYPKQDRPDFLVVIAQCTVKEAWKTKASEVLSASVSWGGRWINLGRPPATVLAIPFVLPVTHADFDELRGLVNVILDRLRLCELLTEAYADDVASIQRWSRTVRNMVLKPAREAVGIDKPGVAS